MNAELWSDHAVKERFIAIPGNGRIGFDDNVYPEPPPAAPADPAVVTPVPASAVVSRAVTPAVVKTRPTLRVRPKLGGKARVGKKLTCTRGTWNGKPTAYVFTWRRDGKTVIAHGSSYTVRKADLGHAVRCDVTARNAKGASTATAGGLRVR